MTSICKTLVGAFVLAGILALATGPGSSSLRAEEVRSKRERCQWVDGALAEALRQPGSGAGTAIVYAPTRKATDQIFKEASIEADPVMEFDNVETVKRAVEINAGIAILPRTTVVREKEQGLLKVLTFSNQVYKRPLALIHRKGRVLTPAMKKLIDLLTSKDLNQLENDEAESKKD